jgi:hypothetical protein
MSIFLRVLNSPIGDKGKELLREVKTINQGRGSESTFVVDPGGFNTIPNTPFAYWVGPIIQEVYRKLPYLEGNGRTVKQGLVTADDFRFLRAWWEVSPSRIYRICNGYFNFDQTISFSWWRERTFKGFYWVPFAKGGNFSPYYADISLVVDWENDGERIKRFIDPNTQRLLSRPQSTSYYFRIGLTWSLRTTSEVSFRPLPSGCIFSHKGPAIVSLDSSEVDLLATLVILNSKPFALIMGLQLGAATLAARSYEVGLLQHTPIPNLSDKVQKELADLALLVFNLVRNSFCMDETNHFFGLPSLLYTQSDSLRKRCSEIARIENERLARLITLQANIDSRVTELYMIPKTALDTSVVLVGDELTTGEQDDIEDDVDELDVPADSNPAAMVADLLMWCVGTAFGRWDVRQALDPARLPPLPAPFDPLPVCSPGMLVGDNGLPLQASPPGYPLPVAWDGFLVDDPGHARDIIRAIRSVFGLLWPGQADAIEVEACQLLGIPDLRTWLRDPRGFFAYHIKRYSKSRRKAPIYWLLQTARRSYRIWLYYPRLAAHSLYYAGREYVDARLNLETSRLDEIRKEQEKAAGAARKVLDRKAAAQEAMQAEIKAFQKELDATARLDLQPDLNDGVLLNIAPLHALVPWKEAGIAWRELLRGQYAWSAIAGQLRQKGMVPK